jgi:hypothetical protein
MRLHRIPVTLTLVTPLDNLTAAPIHNSSTSQDSLPLLVPNHKGKHQQRDRLAPHNIIQTNNTAKVNISTRHIIMPKAKL